MRPTIIFVLFFVCCAGLSAQTLTSIKQVSESMRKTHMSYEVTYLIYDRAKPSVVLEQNSIVCYSWFPYSIYKYPSVEIYHNDKMKLVVNKDRKTILINKADKRYDKMMTESVFSIDSIMKFAKVELKEKKAGKVIYKLSYTHSVLPYDYTEIQIDTLNKRIDHILIYYKVSIGELYSSQIRNPQTKKVVPIVKIEFSKYEKLKKSDWSLFKAEHILKINSAGKVKLAPAYKKYLVTNYYKAL